MSTPLLIVAILASNLLAWVFVFAWIRSKVREITASLGSELAGHGERVVIAPERTNYRGSTGKLPRLKGTSIVALTERRLALRMIKGRGFDVPLADIVSIREANAFAGAYQPGRTVTVFRLASGHEFGLDLVDRVAFRAALASVAPKLGHAATSV